MTESIPPEKENISSIWERLEQEIDGLNANDIDTEEEIDKLIRINFHNIFRGKKLQAKLFNTIKDHFREKRLMNDGERVTLSNKELLYTIGVMLKDPKPTTKIIAITEKYFNKPEGWGKKALEFHPISSQLDCVIEKIVNSDNEQIALINKHALLNKKKLKKSSLISVVLSRFKRAIQLANKLEDKDVAIRLLKQELYEKKQEISNTKELILAQNVMSPRERVVDLRENFPDLSKKDIAEIVGISRPTVYAYLDENSDAV